MSRLLPGSISCRSGRKETDKKGKLVCREYDEALPRAKPKSVF